MTRIVTRSVRFIDPHIDPGACEQLGSGELPLLDPGDDHRRERWARILTEYDTGTQAGSWPGASPGNHVVWCVSPEASSLAGWYAARTGRRLLDHVAEPDPDAGYVSVAVVGLAAELGQGRLERLQAVLRGTPWGLICGRDLAAVSFVMIKTLLAGRLETASSHHVHAEAFDGTVDLPGAGRELEGSFHRLVVEAHGESGHVSVGTTVLCGLLDDAERHAGSEVQGGCDQHRCKRASGRINKRLVDVQAHQVALLTCNSFVARPSLCATNIALVPAALEGWCLQLLGTDRPVAVPRGAGRRMSDGANSLASWAEQLNQHHDDLTGERPYFLAGDPAADMALASLRTTPLVTAEQDQIAAPSLFADDLRNAAEMTAIAQTVRDLDDGTHGDVAASVLVLQRVADKYAAFLRRALRAMQTAHLNGTRHQVHARLREQAGWYRFAWQQALADCLDDGLLQRYLETYFMAGHELHSWYEDGRCSCCDGVIRLEQWRSATGADRLLTKCATCGIRTLRSTKNPLVTASLHGTLVRGGTIGLQLRDAPPGSSVVVHFRDNGDGRFYRIAKGRAVADHLDFAIPVPGDATPEVHTVRLAVVSGQEFDIHRWRFPPDFSHRAWFGARRSS